MRTKRYKTSGLLLLNDCCRTSYRHASRFQTVAGSNSYALGSAFGLVRLPSATTGAPLGTQVRTRSNEWESHDLAVLREINRFFLLHVSFFYSSFFSFLYAHLCIFIRLYENTTSLRVILLFYRWIFNEGMLPTFFETSDVSYIKKYHIYIYIYTCVNGGIFKRFFIPRKWNFD